jgi:hypothetical protein
VATRLADRNPSSLRAVQTNDLINNREKFFSIHFFQTVERAQRILQPKNIQVMGVRRHSPFMSSMTAPMHEPSEI